MKTIPTYAENLSKIIQCPTVSIQIELDTPKAKDANFDLLHKTLRSLYPNVFKTLKYASVGSYSFYLHWKGKDSSRSIVLMAHQDVVPAGVSTGKDFNKKHIPDGWSFPPFSGEIKNGHIRGRGALDDKGSLCALFESIENLIIEGFTPELDIYLCSAHNEETAGWGAPSIVKELEKKGIRPEFVLDEGGAIVNSPLPTMKKQGAMIGLCEKGVANILFTAKSKGGHASAPPKKSPLGQLGSFISKIEKKSPFKAVVTPALQEMLKSVSSDVNFPLSLFFRFPRFFSPLLTSVFTLIGGESRAIVQTTCALTMASGSSAFNVLPDSASVTANLRLLGGVDTLDSVVRQLQKKAKKYNIEVSLISGHEASITSKTDKPYQHIKNIIEKQFPDILPVPYIMIAASDSRHYCKISDNVYRFAPFTMTNAQRKTIHGFDEHIEIKNLEKGIAFYKELIKGIQ